MVHSVEQPALMAKKMDFVEAIVEQVFFRS
jgi:hypothetical protein